jgi:putative transposase
VSQEVEAKLFELARATKELVLKEFRRRSKMYEDTGKIDTSIMPAYRNPEYFQYKRILGSINFDETLRFISDNWKSFKELKDMEKRGELPSWLTPKPPRKLKRVLVVVRYDNYRVDAMNNFILLKYHNIKLTFKGNLRWLGRALQQGRLIIAYDEAKRAWYAHITSKVKLKREKREPLKCGIDLGQERLVAAVAENGVALLYRGTVLKSEYYYLKIRVSALDRAGNFDDFDRAVWLEKRIFLYRQYRLRKQELIKNLAMHLAKTLLKLGVREIYIGYPRNINHDKPTEGNNTWPYWQTIKEIARAAENLGIAAYLVPEENTSKVCARHGYEVVREPRGLVRCPYGHTMHADVNAAMNILKRSGGRVPERVKVLSFTPTPERVIERKRRKKAL